MIYLVYLIVFGFLLTAIIGLLASWIDRKVTARVQYRVGPPVLQPLIDIIKLMGKETLIPVGASKITFLAAPVIGIGSVMLVSTLLWLNDINAGGGFIGDLIVAVYLLAIPSISIIIGGFASASPYASLGASREMKLVLGYELPFVLALLVPVIKSGYSIRIGDILLAQAENGVVQFFTDGVGVIRCEKGRQRFLVMRRHRVVNFRLDTVVEQICFNAIPLRVTDNEMVEHVVHMSMFYRLNELIAQAVEV